MVSKKILITGCRGQLGSDLIRFLSDDYAVTGVDINDLDIRDADSVRRFFQENRPEIVIHSAAYTDVDRAENDVETAMSINAGGTENIARAARDIGARMIYYSTDYVFDGTKREPYIESDQPNPLTVYGKSKLEGEKRVTANLDNHVILRIAWLYGANGKNFVKTMIKLGQGQLKNKNDGGNVTPLKVVNDQMGNPTWSMEIAAQTRLILDKNLVGIYHCTAEGEISWYGFAKAIFAEMEMNIDILPCSSAEFPRPAARPKYSSLENKGLKESGLNAMRHYQIALKDFIKQERNKLIL
jgi:dTDP-4-dehydrorhamnose reductase